MEDPENIQIKISNWRVSGGRRHPEFKSGSMQVHKKSLRIYLDQLDHRLGEVTKELRVELTPQVIRRLQEELDRIRED